MRYRLIPLFLLLLPLQAEEASLLPEAMLPPETKAFWTAPSLQGLKRVLTTSPLYAGALDGTWENAGMALLQGIGVPNETLEPVLWSWIGDLAPEFEGPVALAWLGEGPVALGRLREEASRTRILEALRREALRRKLPLREDGPALACPALRVHVSFSEGWCLAARDEASLAALVRSAKSPPAKSLTTLEAFQKVRGGKTAQSFLYLAPGPAFADAVGWPCALGPDGIRDAVRLLRPGRRPLLDPRPCRLAGALPADAALRFQGRLSGPRIREVLARHLGQDFLADDPLLDALGNWEGELALSFRWMFVLPDLLLGIEAPDPPAVKTSIEAWLGTQGAKKLPGGSWTCPGLDHPFVIEPGEACLWLGTNPQAVKVAAAMKPAEGAAGMRLEARFPELLGPLAAVGKMQPEGSPLARIVQAKARWTADLTEDADGLLLVSDSPWGLQPLLAASALGLQALSARPVAEPVDAVSEAVRERLPAVRELAFKTPLDIRILTPDESAAEISRLMMKELPPEELAVEEEVLRAFGLLKPGQDLGRILTGPFARLVGGFYDPETKALTLIRGMPAQAVIAAHEMTHALQDQHHDLLSAQEAFKKGRRDSDRELAFTALVEGDATHLMEEYLKATAGGNPIAGVRILLEALAQPDLILNQLRAMRDMPPGLMRSVTFPYEDGKDFVAGIRKTDGWKAVDAMFAHPPVSSEQILHPEKYAEATRDDPVEVALEAAPEGWDTVSEDTMGELGIQVLLTPGLGRREAEKAAAGWGGDRFALYRKGTERLIVWRTVWDTEGDAAEFLAAARRRYPAAKAAQEGMKAEVSLTP